MKVSSNFDGGNIHTLLCEEADDIRLEVLPDNNSEFLQWFYFRVSGVRNKQCLLRIMNAGECSFAYGWEDYRAVASYDRKFWFRVDTYYEDGELSIQHQPAYDAVYYAYFAPYSMEQHANLIAVAQTSPRATVINLGETIDGQDLDLIRIGELGEDKKVCWATARQHPGETMAEWWMEGFISRLLDSSDPVSRELLEKMVFYVVPNMNPDGSRRGHIRTNTAGINLNREWQNPSMEHSPEVYLVREQMLKTGVDIGLDIHGDAGLPYNFIVGAEGIPSWTDERESLVIKFKNELMKINPDFQTTHGYERNAPNEADLTICSNYLSEEFGCLAMTLEMPLKDTIDSPNLLQGWSPERSTYMGASFVEAVYRVLDDV